MRETGPVLDNADVADKLDEVATLLEAQHANRYRVAAYRRGAETVRGMSEPIGRVAEREGVEGLEHLPGIGETLARAIVTMHRTGSFPQLERLRGEVDPEALLRSLPGIGPELAERLHRELHVDTLEDLEVAAYDGRLADVEGFGPKRLEGVRAALDRRLRRVRSARAPAEPPPVEELLDVDAEYRRKADAGELPTIAPRRMNPSGDAWLPVLHTSREGRSYTALFSNTPLAHRLDRTDDWVVIYLEDGASERPYTVVTERRGSLAGRRVVRGREDECREVLATGAT